MNKRKAGDEHPADIGFQNHLILFAIQIYRVLVLKKLVTLFKCITNPPMSYFQPAELLKTSQIIVKGGDRNRELIYMFDPNLP